MPDMRFAPPNPIRIADRSSGMNAVSVRSYNERLVLSLLLQNQGLSRMEIGNRTGLSAQTVSVIVRSLEQEGLVTKGEAVKGRMGPPTIPLSLNPEGAYSVGISLGHRHTDVVMIDFIGQPKFYTSLPLPREGHLTNHSKLVETVGQALAALPDRHEGRLAGIGIAMPEDREELALGPTGMAERFETLSNEIEGALGVEVYVQNDITAAAAGESMFGAAKSLDDYLFFYIGARLHHRLVLNHQIFQSRAPASKPMGLMDLERRLLAKGVTTDNLWERGAEWPDLGGEKETWLKACVAELKSSLESASQFLPVSTVIVSSYAPSDVCKEIAQRLSMVCGGVESKPGELQITPKALGAASLPFSSKFVIET
ncbi:ROK family transcriptional regulator [Roseobacter sp. HKCCA2468]|uniref:ROK family transcriptional regulator n=1 Tax=Roseobacter sp. HKCCA2468 TaxID=3120342 RepID=UPI0030EF969D